MQFKNILLLRVKNMKILLINPPRFYGMSVIREERCERVEGFSVLEPYSLLQLGAILRNNGHSVKLIDANGENLNYSNLKKKIKEEDYEVMIFRFTPTTFDHDMKITEISKKINKDAKTIGICFTLRTLPLEVMKEAKYMDIYVGSNYDTIIPEIIEKIDELEKVKGIAYRKGNLDGTINVNGNLSENFKERNMPIPAYDLLSSFEYYYVSAPHGKPFTIMYTSKGCPFSCTYCTVANTKFYIRDSESILKEIGYLKKNYGIKTISFFDETFTLDRDRVLDICKKIKNFKITWYCNTRTDLVDRNLLKKMKEAGCKGISFGIESGNQKILDNVMKGTKVNENFKAIKLAKSVGIKVHCSFILGLPGETKETVKDTINFVKKALPNGVEFNIATPYPGTKLFNYLVKSKEGNFWRKINWKNLYQDIAKYTICELTIEELEKARISAYKSIYLNPKWIFQNFVYLLKNPEDFPLGVRYFLRYSVLAPFYGWSTHVKRERNEKKDGIAKRK